MSRKDNKYLKLYEETNKNQSMRMYLSIINIMFDFFGMEDPTIEDIRSITVDDANDFLDYVKNDLKYENGTINKYMKACSSFYKLLRRQHNGLVDFDPFSTEEGAVRLKEKTFSAGIRITDENLRKMYQYFYNDMTLKGTMEYIAFLILVSTGIRRAEVTRIQLGDFFKYGNKWGLHYTGKGNKPLITMISGQVKSVIDEYVNRQCWDWTMKEQWLFPSSRKFGDHMGVDFINGMMERMQKALDLDQDVTTHDFRHTYVTKSIELGKPLEDVSRRVGHSSIETTKRYDHADRIFNDNPADDILDDVIIKNQKVVKLVI